MIRVTAAIIINNDRILIAQRLNTDKLAGKWEFPGGKIENNETPEQCLIREMKEEFEFAPADIPLVEKLQQDTIPM